MALEESSGAKLPKSTGASKLTITLGNSLDIGVRLIRVRIFILLRGTHVENVPPVDEHRGGGGQKTSDDTHREENIARLQRPRAMPEPLHVLTGNDYPVQPRPPRELYSRTPCHQNRSHGGVAVRVTRSSDSATVPVAAPLRKF
jgi:hypothetical protein